MYDKFFEDFFNDFDKNLNGLLSNFYYYSETNVGGKKVIQTNIPNLTEKQFKSKETQALESTISSKTKEMRLLALKEDFENALLLKKELEGLKLDLSTLVERDSLQQTENKTSKTILDSLKVKLDELVADEKYVEAAAIRDQIKALTS